MKTIGNLHCAGTYLVKAGNIPIYVGQANDISDRFFSPRFSHVTKMNELKQQVKEQGTRFFELKPGQYKYAIMYRLWDHLTLEKVGERDEEAELIVIYDDISLDVGQLRIRKKGSAGGHNGIKNIILHLGHDTFQRIKIGVGEKPKGYDLADYVLGHFSAEELAIIKESLVKVCGAVELMIEDHVDEAMNQYNKKA